MNRLLFHHTIFLAACLLMGVTGLIGTDQQISFNTDDVVSKLQTDPFDGSLPDLRTVMVRVRRPAAPCNHGYQRCRTIPVEHAPPELGPPCIRADDRSDAEPG